MTTSRNHESGGMPQERSVEYRGTGFYVSVVFILLTAVILLILAVQNTAQVAVEFLAWEFELPLFAIIVGAGLIAVLLDELIGLVWRRQRRTRLEERAELERLRAERRHETNRTTGPDEQAGDGESSRGPDLSAPVGTDRRESEGSRTDR